MRYIPNSPEEREEMLASVGLANANELFRSIPEDVQLNRPLKITDPLAESEVIAAFVQAQFSGEERHVRRLGKIDAIEREFLREP